MTLLPPHTAEQYAQRLTQLLPRGLAWVRGKVLFAFFTATADELARVDASAHALAEDVNPLFAVHSLPDWERVLALPDACTHAGATLQERRAMVVAKLNACGRQDKQYYMELAAQLGYSISISVFPPFVVGRARCGSVLHGKATSRFVWRVTVHGNRHTFFRTGASQGGDRLCKLSRAQDLECIFHRYRQAHTVLIFAYE